MAEDKTPEQDEVETPAEETPAAQAEETPAAPAEEAPVAADADEVVVEGDAIVTDEDLEEDEEEDVPATPRVKPAIPGADLEVDIVREGEEALRGGSEYDEDAYEDGHGAEADAEDFSPPIADDAI